MCNHKDYFKDLDNNDYCLGNIHKIKSVGFAKSCCCYYWLALAADSGADNC